MPPRETDDLMRLLRAVDSWETMTPLGIALVDLVSEAGNDALRPLVAARFSAAGIAAALAYVSTRGRADILDLFTPEELLNGVVAYLESDATGDRFPHQWAWMGLWFGKLPAGQRLDLILRLLPLAPDDDDALWLIGDGPLSEAEMEPQGADRVIELCRSNPRLARIKELVGRDLSGG